ncbi:hypothetical protein [Staphylococcus gallinarum]|nr:hypothetical protein [Staphylococcus gallinarum]
MGVDDLAKQLSVSSSTIKKYYLLIEERGYLFHRNKQGHITFSQDDLRLFRNIFEIKSQPKTTVNSSIDQALKSLNRSNFIDNQPVLPDAINLKEATEISKKLSSLSLHIENQEQTIKKQNALIKQQGELLHELVKINQQNKDLLEQDSNKFLLKDNLTESNKIKERLIRIEEQLHNLGKRKWWKFW